MERQDQHSTARGPPIYSSATVHLKLPAEVSQRILVWSRHHIPDDWLFDPASVPPSSATSESKKKKKTKSGAGFSDPKKAKPTLVHSASPGPTVYLPPCGRVFEPHVTMRGGLREVDFEAIRRDLQSPDQPDHYILQFGRVAIWNSGYYGIVVVNVAATKPMNDLFRRLGRHPTQSTSDKGRNNLKPHATIAYLRKDKIDALLLSLRSSSKAMLTLNGEEAGEASNLVKTGTDFLLNEMCTVDRFEFGWRDGTTTLVPIRPPEQDG